MTACNLHLPSEVFLIRIQDGYSKDAYFSDERLTRKLQFDGCLWRRNSAIVVPDCDDFRHQCIALHHDSPFSGHLGKDRTLHLISRHYWWPSIYGDVLKLC